MESKSVEITKGISCQLPRKKEAIEALLGLAWRKEKKARPSWLIRELSSYSQL